MTGFVIYHLSGCLLTLPVMEQRNALNAAVDRLEELAAAANCIAQSCPTIRAYTPERFVVTEAPMPELMDTRNGETLVRIEEQKIPEAHNRR